MNTEQSAGDVVSKAEFARRRNVTPGRVSQWIAEGKIGGRALVGEGRNARIDEVVACSQLDRALDIGQRLSNGLGTRLALRSGSLELAAPAEPEPPRSAGGPPLPPGPRNVNDQIAEQRLEQLQRQNRDGARQEAIAAGLLTDANAVRQVVGRETAKLVTQFESALASFASALAAQFKLPQRDLLHALRGEYRKFRAEASDTAHAAAAAVPETVTFDVPEPDRDSKAAHAANRGAEAGFGAAPTAAASAATPLSPPAPSTEDGDSGES